MKKKIEKRILAIEKQMYLLDAEIRKLKGDDNLKCDLETMLYPIQCNTQELRYRISEELK